MSDQTSRILNERFENKKFIEAYTLHSKNSKENIRRNEKFCQYDIDENKDLTT